MPLDLHVLGLSLAFILSQDQTLRCFYINFSVFFLFYNRLVTLDLFEYLSPRTRIVITRTAIPSVLFPLCFLLSFVLVYRNYFNVLFRSRNPAAAVFVSESECKVTHFFLSGKFFMNFFSWKI